MGIVQQATGTAPGGAFTVTLPATSSAANRVAVIVCGNTTVTTPGGWTLRTSQVNFMGHYLFDRAGGSATYAFTANAGAITWYAAEITAGVFDGALSSNATAGAASYTTPALTPTAGVRTVLASLGSTSTVTARTISGWTGGFDEVADIPVAAADNPMQGVAALDVTANGTTAYSTTGTYSDISPGRTAIIAAYQTSAAEAETKSGTGTITATATLTASGEVGSGPTAGGSGSISATPVVTSAGYKEATGNGYLDFTTTLSASGTAVDSRTGTGTITATATTTSVGGKVGAGSATIEHAATLAASGEAQASGSGAGSITSSAVLSGLGSKAGAGSVTVTVEHSLTGTGSKTVAGSATLTDAASLTGSGSNPEQPAFVNIPDGARATHRPASNATATHRDVTTARTTHRDVATATTSHKPAPQATATHRENAWQTT